MADTKKFRLDAIFKLIRNNVSVMKESPDTGEIDFTDAAWNELQLASGGGFIQLPFNIDMTGFNHMLIISDQDLSVSGAAGGPGSFKGKIFIISGTGASANTTAPYVSNGSSFTANIRFALVD